MKPSPRTKIVAAVVLFVLLGVSLFAAHRYFQRVKVEEGFTQPLFRMSDRISTLEVTTEEENGENPPSFIFEDAEGNKIQLTAAEFAEQLLERQKERMQGGLFYRVFDITSLSGVFWVSLGLLGQFLFTGRMIVQWMASEKEKRSVVPNMFWWMSIGGSSLLIIYFTWRVDVVGVLGQSTGWFIYLRNLWFIYKNGEPVPVKK